MQDLEKSRLQTTLVWGKPWKRLKKNANAGDK
jgi:hypothetical protein